MANDFVVKYGEPILREKCEECKSFDDEVKAKIDFMYDRLAEAEGCLGLAGPQLGIKKRIFVYDLGEGRGCLVNPKIVRSSGEETMLEGCMSFPGLHGEVTRALRVTVTGLDERGVKVKLRAEGLLARLFQHEIDHLDGILFIDKADPDTLELSSPDDDAHEAANE